MRPFEESERRQADLFYADLIGRRPPRGPRPVVPAPRSFSGVRRVGDPIGAGWLFDSIVHRGVDPNTLLAAEAEDDGGAWEAIALPRSATPPELLPRGALVVERALGDGRFGCMRVLGDDVPVGALYGRDGRIRADVLVLVRVGVARPA